MTEKKKEKESSTKKTVTQGNPPSFFHQLSYALASIFLFAMIIGGLYFALGK